MTTQPYRQHVTMTTQPYRQHVTMTTQPYRQHGTMTTQPYRQHVTMELVEICITSQQQVQETFSQEGQLQKTMNQ